MKKIIVICLLVMGALIAPSTTKASSYYMDENGFVYNGSAMTSFISVFDENSDYNSVNLIWWGGEGCDYYNVYRATSKNGKYYLVGTTTQPFYRVSGLVTEKTYHFKVRGYSQHGMIESLSITGTPQLNDIVSIGSYNGKLQWGAIKGAQGYAVYRAKDGGTYKKIATTKTTSYGLKKGYTYKVRAYRKVNGKYYYSSYSKAVKG